MLEIEDSTVPKVLALAGGNLQRLALAVSQELQRLPEVHGTQGQQMQSRDLTGSLNTVDRLSHTSDAYVPAELYRWRYLNATKISAL